MATQLSQKRASEPATTIPDRLYFKIGDVARICGLETYVLRFWESQFPQLKPNKSGTGQRLYRRREVELVLEIKRLVHKEGYTLPGARHVLDQQGRRAGGHEAKALKDGKGLQDTNGSQDAREVQEVWQETRQESRQDPQQDSPFRQSGSARRIDAVAATIGHARAELREIAALLATPAPQPMRRRSRLAAVMSSSDSLFPS